VAESIGILGSGEPVIDRYNSHLHEGVSRLLPAAFAQISSLGRKFFVEEVDFGRSIGETVCVQTTDADEVVWAKRPKRFGHSRFVKNRPPEPCSSVVIILKTADGEADRGKYVLVAAFVGIRPEPEPWDRNATANSRAFWASHALIWGCEPIVPGTETTVCPW